MTSLGGVKINGECLILGHIIDYLAFRLTRYLVILSIKIKGKATQFHKELNKEHNIIANFHETCILFNACYFYNILHTVMALSLT